MKTGNLHMLGSRLQRDRAKTVTAEVASTVCMSTRSIWAEYPELAVRQVIENAFCHADYRVASQILVKQYSNEVELSDPGGLSAASQPKAFCTIYQLLETRTEWI